MLCDAPRRQKDLAKLARRLTQHQRHALRIRPNRQGLLTVKNNQPTLRQNIAQVVPVPPTGFSPSGADALAGLHRALKTTPNSAWMSPSMMVAAEPAAPTGYVSWAWCAGWSSASSC